MNRKSRPRNQPQPLKAEVPANVGPNHPGKAKSYLTRQWLDEVAAGTEKGLRDTYAWKAAVQRLGLKEARRRLRLSCLASQCLEGNPQNGPARLAVSKAVQRTLHPAAALAHDMGVNHGRRDIFMSEQFLDGSDIRSAL